MPKQNLSDTTISWAFESFTSGTITFSGILICITVLFIYTRSGSLIFLRDIMWRLVGGEKFENDAYERSRKTLREIEHYRFEFNIPAQTLEQADLAEQWISKNDLSHRDIARITSYINWKNFNQIYFKTDAFSKAAERTTLAGLIISLLAIVIAPPTASSDYLLASLKNSPDTPSFYLSETGAKFGVLSNELLTTHECSSPQTLKKFITTNISEENLDAICSLFLDQKYTTHVKSTLREQRIFIFWSAISAIACVFLSLVKLTRINTARKLNEKLKNNETTPPAPQ